ncbi:hypothetical protein GDO81_019524 [Engystomops pustulosus]|uniref:Uncharacterized protein n=1 Tax=Engystomops pustulosus TaxID=76066 RepID=A0AAV6YYV1_ENGPU|nr:hypothetical protein GDO81_019524 [Engystomops pustulosus]
MTTRTKSKKRHTYRSHHVVHNPQKYQQLGSNKQKVKWDKGLAITSQRPYKSHHTSQICKSLITMDEKFPHHCPTLNAPSIVILGISATPPLTGI